jgi:hypothetical protein
MSRRHIDCRQSPSESNCTIAISADSEDELIDAAAQHAVQVHGHMDSPELRTQLNRPLPKGSPLPSRRFARDRRTFFRCFAALTSH